MTNETVCEKLLKSAFRRVLTALQEFLNLIENEIDVRDSAEGSTEYRAEADRPRSLWTTENFINAQMFNKSIKLIGHY